jgi:hypothetical protein
MDKEHYKMTMVVEDWSGRMVYSKEFEGDSPHTYNFANFCHTAGLAYGFTEQQMDNYIEYT